MSRTAESAAATARPRTPGGGPAIGVLVTTLLLLSVAALLIVPLLSATRTLAERRSVDRLLAATELPVLVERTAGAALDPGAAPEAWRAPGERARRIAAVLAGAESPRSTDGSPAAARRDDETSRVPLSPALLVLEDVPGGTEAAFALVVAVEDLLAAAGRHATARTAAVAGDDESAANGAAAAVSPPGGTMDASGRSGAAESLESHETAAAVRHARDAARSAARRLGDVLRRDAARGLAGRLRFDGALIAAVVLLGLLQVALLVRLRRLNAGLHGEIDRRTASERRLRDREVELERLAAELRTARDDARAADRAKSRFLATMSHEFRTPLNGILGFTWLIERGLAEARPDDVVADVRRIRGAGEHMLRLVSDVLDLAKVEAGMMVPEPAPIDADALVRESANAADAAARTSGGTVRLDAEPLGPARTDRTRMRQVLDNLLSNAVRFSGEAPVTLRARRLPAGTPVPSDVRGAPRPEGGAASPALPPAPGDRPDAVHVEGTVPPEDADRLLLSVIDGGPGMTDRELAAAFEEFVQVDDSATRRHGGTGLGLALVRRLTDLLGGGLVAASRPGAGSRFTVIVPATLAPASPSATGAAAESAPPATPTPPEPS